MTELGRRKFLKGCCLAAGAGLGVSGARYAFADANTTEKILVVLFLRGGCDGLSLFPPLSGSDRGYYETARPTLQIPLSGAGAALDLNGQFGVHPAGAPLKDLYDQGLLAIVRAVGNTVQPSRSHFDAQALLESGTPGTKGTATGWLTRYFSTLDNLTPSIIIPSLAASSYTPTSFIGDPYVLTTSNPGSFELSYAHWGWDARQREVISSLYGGTGLVEHAGHQALTAEEIISGEDFSNYTPAGGAIYPSGTLGNRLKMLAQIIKMDVGLRVSALDFGGWDTHNGQGDGSSGYFADNLVTPLAAGLSAFLTDMDASGGNYMQRLTLVVQTEFGRRFRQNADSGTDHGFGSDMLVAGGEVNGGQFHGLWPGLATAQLFEGVDVDVSTDFRRILSEILIRRLQNPYLGAIFPGYTDYTPLGVVQGQDMEPVYDGSGSNAIFADGFED